MLEPDYYLVECARRDQAITVAKYFDAHMDDMDFIAQIEPLDFPVRVGRLNNDSFIVLHEREDTKLSLHTDIIDFKNWIVIRGEDSNDIKDLYEKLGMET